jgi:hypothetical protein
MQFKYPKASETLTESRGQFFKIDHVLDPAECSESLDGIASWPAKLKLRTVSETLEGLTSVNAGVVCNFEHK